MKCSVIQLLFALMGVALLSATIGFFGDKYELVGEQRDRDNLSLVATTKQVLKDAGAAGADNDISSSTGSLFHGLPIRTYREKRQFEHGHDVLEKPEKKKPATSATCENWAVVTTINEATEAIQRTASLPESWCTVIIADTKTPITSYVEMGKKNKNVHFLSVEDQLKWGETGSKVAKFIDEIPYKHFARKNIGFLYAIQHDAKFVFDYDDDNLLLKDSKEVVLDPVPKQTTEQVRIEKGVKTVTKKQTKLLYHVRVPVVGKNVLNHHPLMNATVPNSWARGLPLDSIQDVTTQGLLAYSNSTLRMKKIAVMQLVANGNPDVDAVHRLTKPLPMNFEATTPLMVPPHALAPYNAQATVHTRQALFATLLPATVPGRVSDIWRGYFAQVLFRYLDLRLVFMPPRVVQIRNVHSYLADMNAELDLYFKSTKLVEFLSNWSSSTGGDSIPQLMEELWIDLYERGYIEEQDVKLLQLWLGALVETGYDFSPIIRRRNDEVVVMGQFNYANELKAVLFWNQKWRQAFGKVQVRGPWNDAQLAELQQWGIAVHHSDYDRGFVSPVENLMLALQEYQNDTTVKGVMYLHDDMFVNLPRILGENAIFPTSEIIRCIPDKGQYSILSDGSYQNATGTKFKSLESFTKTLKPWAHWETDCIPPITEIAQDERSTKYKQPDGSLTIPMPGQSDFVYIPTQYTADYREAARLFVERKVFLECAFPTLVEILHSTKDASVNTVAWWSKWDSNRGQVAMMDGYDPKSSKAASVVHPIKLSIGLEKWGEAFDFVTLHDD